MHLPYMRRMAPEVLATARAQRWDPAEVLKVLLGEEVAGCERSALATRRAQAAFPTGKTFSTWDANLSSIPAPTQTALGTLEWIGRHENLVVCGPSGTGKTFFLEGLGQLAVEADLKVAGPSRLPARRCWAQERGDADCADTLSTPTSHSQESGARASPPGRAFFISRGCFHFFCSGVRGLT